MKPTSPSLLLFAASFAVAALQIEAQTPRDIVGTWELTEWIHEGEALRPPVVGGRLSLRDGTVMFIAHRQDQAGNVHVSGYGPYFVDDDGYSYGYDIQTRVEGGAVVYSQSFPIARFTGVLVDGGLVLADDETGTWGLILQGDSLVYFENGEHLRRYVRVRE